MRNNLNYIFRRVVAFFIIFIIMSFIKACEVHAEEFKYISVTPTSLHTYISTANVGNSNLVTFSNPTYREILSSSNGYTWTLNDASSPRLITKLAFNVFGDFYVNRTYKIHWETNFPNDMNLENYTCSMGSYTNNTAFPPYSNSSCSISRSDNGSVIMEGQIVIENGSYVTMIITPKVGIDTTHTYDYFSDDVPDLITKTFTLQYGSVKAMELKSTTDSIDNASSQAHSDSQNTQNAINSNTNAVNNQTNTMKDDSVDSADNKASEWANKSLSDNAVATMVTMPITLLNAYVNGLNGSCSPYSLGTLFDHEIILPCINIGGLVGSTLWGIIDILFSGFMIYAIGKKFVKIFNDFTNLKDNQVDELYGGGN